MLLTKIMASLEPGTNYFSKLMLKLEFGQMWEIVSKYKHSRKKSLSKKKKKRAFKTKSTFRTALDNNF